MDRSQLEELLESVVRTGGSTLHLMPGERPFVRVRSDIVESEDEALTAESITGLMRDFLFQDHRQRLHRGEEVDVLYTAKFGTRFRTTVARQESGLSVVFRLVPAEVPTLEEVGFPNALEALPNMRRGLILLTGFFGSGKSTTLAALLDWINRQRHHHVVTVERRIEYFHQSKLSLVHQREVGSHVASTAEGVREGCRQSADVIAIDGIEDFETLSAACDAVERGCLVIGTVDASGVAGALTELTRLMPIDARDRERGRLADLLRIVTSQSLISRLHGDGRVSVFEVMIRTRQIAEVIREGRYGELSELMQRGRGLGMQTTDQALRALLSHNVIAPDEAAYHAVDHEFVQGTSRFA